MLRTRLFMQVSIFFFLPGANIDLDNLGYFSLFGGNIETVKRALLVKVTAFKPIIQNVIVKVLKVAEYSLLFYSEGQWFSNLFFVVPLFI